MRDPGYLLGLTLGWDIEAYFDSRDPYAADAPAPAMVPLDVAVTLFGQFIGAFDSQAIGEYCQEAAS